MSFAIYCEIKMFPIVTEPSKTPGKKGSGWGPVRWEVPVSSMGKGKKGKKGKRKEEERKKGRREKENIKH